MHLIEYIVQTSVNFLQKVCSTMINVIVKNVNHYINACFVMLQSFFPF